MNDAAKLESIKKLLATAKTPKERKMYQDLLNKMDPPKLQVEEKVLETKPTLVVSPKPNRPQVSIPSGIYTSSGISKPQRPLVIKQEVRQEPKPELEPQVNPLFQAIGIVVGDITFEENKAFIKIADVEYNLLYVHKKKMAFKGLKEQIETTGITKQRIIVYPKIVHFPTRDTPYDLAFQLVGYVKNEGKENTVTIRPGIQSQLNDFEFILKGLWQFIPVCRTPCISIYKNFTKDRLTWLKEMEPYRQVRFMKGCHAPLLWKDSSVKPVRFNPKVEKDKMDKPYFVAVKAKFLPQRNAFAFVEELGQALDKPPNYFKASKKLKAEALENKPINTPIISTKGVELHE